MHALAELGHDRARALAPEQITAEFFLELANRARQRRLGDIALLGCTREIQRTRDRRKYRTWCISIGQANLGLYPPV